MLLKFKFIIQIYKHFSKNSPNYFSKNSPNYFFNFSVNFLPPRCPPPPTQSDGDATEKRYILISILG